MSVFSSLSLPLLAEAGGFNPALLTFLGYTLAVFSLAVIANYLRKDGNFLSEYFLGNRGLGVWAFALTFAATSASGGSFTGFPSKIYSHGWILGLWIGSYIIFPICTMGFIGKRLNQVARRSGAKLPGLSLDEWEHLSAIAWLEQEELLGDYLATIRPFRVKSSMALARHYYRSQVLERLCAEHLGRRKLRVLEIGAGARPFLFMTGRRFAIDAI